MWVDGMFDRVGIEIIANASLLTWIADVMV